MHCLIILPKHGFELVNVSVILFFLEGNIDDGLRNVVIHLLQLFSLLDQYFEIISEVDFISVLSRLDQYFLFKEFHCLLHDP